MIRIRWVLIWLAAVAFAAALSALIPPMQSPDEHSHVLRADSLARGQWLLETPPGESTGGRMDEGLLLFTRPYLTHVVSERAKKLTPEQRAGVRALRWSGREHFFPIPGTGYYFPLVYAPHAAALGVGRALDLTIANSYRLTRLFTIGACAALLIAAFRLWRPPPLACALLLLPMTLFQLVQPTLDGITTSIAVVALSLFARRAFDPEPVPQWHGPVLAACLFLVATSRVQLAPLLLLPLWLAWRERSRRDLVAGLLAIVASAAWTAWALLHTVDARVTRAESTSQLAVHYLTHPWEYVRLVAASFADTKLSVEYARSFIGVVGWLDTHLALYWYPTLWIGLALLLACSAAFARPREALQARALLVAAALASVALAFFALLVTWTPHPARVIDGIQGRYFIVPALAVAYAMARPPGGACAPRWPAAVVAVFGALCLYALISTLLARYH